MTSWTPQTKPSIHPEQRNYREKKEARNADAANKASDDAPQTVSEMLPKQATEVGDPRTRKVNRNNGHACDYPSNSNCKRITISLDAAISLSDFGRIDMSHPSAPLLTCSGYNDEYEPSRPGSAAGVESTGPTCSS